MVLDAVPQGEGEAEYDGGGGHAVVEIDEVPVSRCTCSEGERGDICSGDMQWRHAVETSVETRVDGGDGGKEVSGSSESAVATGALEAHAHLASYWRVGP